jgi:hypothetical protein
MNWASYPKDSIVATAGTLPATADVTLAMQVVQQVNYGPLESKRYFVKNGEGSDFVEVTEQWLIDANFQKLNT